jgi:hypothetical protein
VVRTEAKKTIIGVLAPKETDEYPLINIRMNITVNKIGFPYFPIEGLSEAKTINNPTNDKPK